MPLAIRILIACGIAFLWMLIAANFQTGLTIVKIPLDWVISGIVFAFIYSIFFQTKIQRMRNFTRIK